MNHAIVRSPRPPAAWADFEYAALYERCADDLEDCINEGNPDSEDERVAIEIVLHGMIQGAG